MDTPIYEIGRLPGFNQFFEFLMNCRKSTWEKICCLSIREMKENNMISDAEDVFQGLKYMQELINAGVQIDHEIWSDEEKKEEPDRCGTKLFYFPGKPESPFILICPGGGYQSVCSFLEGFPTAFKLNQAGYNAFVLSYRVRQDSLMPKPIEDVAKALQHILKNVEKYKTGYIYGLMGFSAGGHLAAEMVTTNMGLVNYGIQMPKALVLCYAPIDLRVMGTGEIIDNFKKAFLKKDAKQDEECILKQYSINLHLSEECPPVYFWQCRDDVIVPFENYRRLETILKEKKIPNQGILYERGGHGLTKPHDNFADHWLDDVILFLNHNL